MQLTQVLLMLPKLFGCLANFTEMLFLICFIFTVFSIVLFYFLYSASSILKLHLSHNLSFFQSVRSNSLWPHGLEHARLPCPSPSPGACSNSCSLSWWCHLNILSSVIPLSSCLPSFPASGFFLMSWLFTSGGQIIGVSASASILPINIQD